ncbi:MAG: hypothetical protein ABII13_01880 [Patescibacteria group bacterium]|nr:hypothetical protein [Patescibacteria group bacterium]MBU2509559.1 hypothetical protein [Patescibacteria group bacterium]
MEEQKSSFFLAAIFFLLCISLIVCLLKGWAIATFIIFLLLVLPLAVPSIFSLKEGKLEEANKALRKKR